VELLVLYPLDLIKVRLQVNEDVLISANSTHKRLTFLQACRAVIKHEGVMGLYQGLNPAVVGSAVSWGGYFFVYEGMKRQYIGFKRPDDPDPSLLNSLDNFMLATASGAVMVALTNPVWLIKTRMQLQMNKTASQHSIKPYNSMWDAAITIVREEGITALYKGGAAALMLTSHGGVQFVAYEYLKKRFKYARATRTSKRESVLERLQKSIGYLAMGGVSKIIASTVTYPLQVIKARMQQRSDSLQLTSTGEVRRSRRDYTGFVASCRRIWQAEGMRGFFKGCLTNAIRVAPGAAVTFLVYEATMDGMNSTAL